jgi:hypothetical protein
MKTKKYTKRINLIISEKQFKDLQTIKENSGKTISKLMRENIVFLLEYYK